jgi:hypothetical protein
MKTGFVIALLSAFIAFGNNAHASDYEKTFIDTPVASEDARDHIGQNRMVCGTVEFVNLKKYGTFINMGTWETLPNGRVVLSPSFTAIMWENDRIKLEVNPTAEFLRKNVCFSGVISSSPVNRYTVRPIPQITIRHLKQIKIIPSTIL